MKKQVIALTLLAAALTACGTDDGGDEEATTSPPATPRTATSPPAATTTEVPQGTGTKPPITSGDWRLDSITVRDNGFGDFAGRARITYTGDNPDGGTNTFTVTVFKDGKDVASLKGSASDVPSGRTITADLISTDNFVAGPYTYDFQKDF